MHERLEHRNERSTVLAQNVQGVFAHAAEDTFGAAEAKRVEHVGGEAKRHDLRPCQRQTLVEQAVKIDVHALAAVDVEQDVLGVAVACVEERPSGLRGFFWSRCRPFLLKIASEGGRRRPW